MKNEVYVDLLRTTLIEHGHVVPKRDQLRNGDEILLQGEYLVSILFHDRSLRRLFELADDIDGTYRCGRWSVKKSKEGAYTLSKTLRRDVENYIDLVKFIWLRDGAGLALAIAKAGFVLWASVKWTERAKRVDALVFQAQNELRESGMKFSEIAEFFQDNGCAASWVTMLFRTAGQPAGKVLKALQAGLSLIEWEGAVNNAFTGSVDKTYLIRKSEDKANG